MASTSYADVAVRNIRAWRARQKLDQADVVERMRNLGFKNWHRQTLSRIEQGERRVTVEELLGLSYALDVTMPRLLEPQPDDQRISLPGGMRLPARSVQLLVAGTHPRTFAWKGNVPVLREVVAGWAGDPDMPGELKDALKAADYERDER
jgi:transcriptional regulator with XRE-family HTH domain